MSAEGLGPQQMARIEELVQEIETLPDAKSRETAAELVQLLMDFYGQGLARMLAIAGNAESHVVDSYGQDPLVSQILMLHGLHPIDLPTRVEKGAGEGAPAAAFARRRRRIAQHRKRLGAFATRGKLPRLPVVDDDA